MQISHYLPRLLPTPLKDLALLALDLRWSWHHGEDNVWKAISPNLWQATGNAWMILESVSDHRLQELSQDQAFLSILEHQLKARPG